MGFALIVAMIVAVSGVISGFSSQIFGLTAQAGSSESIYIKPSSPSDYISPALPSMLNHTNIEVVLPLMEKTIDIQIGNTNYTLKIVGTNLSTLLNFYSQAEMGGTLPILNNTPIQCLIGESVEPNLSTLEIMVKNSTGGFTHNFHISGTIQNVNEFQHAVLIELDDYLTFFNTTLNQTGYHRVKILLKNGAFIQDTIMDLQQLLQDQISEILIKPEKQANIFASSMLSDVVKHLNFLFGILFIIALIRIYHSISWFLTNYEREFLIMKTCGLSSLQLLALIGVLVLIIGNSGLIIGVFFGFITPSIIFTFLNLFFYSTYLIPEFSFSSILAIAILSNTVALLAAAFPALRISLSKPNKLSIDTRGLER